MKKLLLTTALFLTLGINWYFIFKNDTKWENSIENPDNSEFVVEVAFNLNIETSEVTQEQFNTRYLQN